MLKKEELKKRKSNLSPAKQALLEKWQRGENKSVSSLISQRPNPSSSPLSFAQQRLWFLNQLEPESGVYNISAAVRIEGQLNPEILAQSFSEIIRRHEVLRTNFVKQDDEDGAAVQIIHPPSDWQMSITDLQALPISEREAEIKRLVIAEAAKPFNLATDQLIRGTLLLVSEREHVLLLTMHHIVSDGWSMGILIQEITTLYSAFIEGKPSPLSELAIQYADFAVWQREWLTGEELQNQLSYWQKQLVGAAPRLELPTDRPRPAVQTFQGAHQSFRIPLELTKGLTTLSQLEGTTLFMTLLAAFQTLLYRYTGQTDISVGSSIANRNHEEIEGLIGFFVNTLVLRTQLENHPSFRELLQQVREVSLGAYAHQDLPFEMLVEQLQPERNLSHNSLFQVRFVLQNAPTSELEFGELTLSELPVDNNTAKFDLTLSLHETEDGLRGNWEYNTHLFDEQTISRMAGHFHTLLEGIVANPEQKVSELPILSEVERHQLLFDWNNTSTEYPLNKCIHTLFEEQVERTPEAVAVVLENQQLTYRELNHRANQLAHYLQTQGVGVETLVGICVERSLEMVVGLLGILKAGGAYVPLDPNYPKERLAYMIADAQISLLLTQQQFVDEFRNLQAATICLDTDWSSKIATCDESVLVSETASENLAYVIYTSGSTGNPKGVMIEHRQLSDYFNSIQTVLDLPLGANYATVSTIAADLGNTVIFASLCSGGCLHIISNERITNTKELADYFKDNSIDCLKIVPSHLKALLTSEASSQILPRQRLVLGGESSSWELIEQVRQLAPECKIINHYGPTEATVGVLTNEVERVPDTRQSSTVPIGRPLANTQIYILDSNKQPVPIGVPGELHIGGDGLARGYLNRPELTAEKFIPNPFSDDSQARVYKTGDKARYLSDGNIEYLGRLDNQVKIRGFRIEMGEVEAVLSQYPNVKQTKVIAREDNTPGEQRLVAYLVVNVEQNPSTRELRQFLKPKLPDYMMPAAFVYLDTLPLTPNGKIDRRALPVPDLEQQLTVSFVAPRTQVEEMLAQMWADVLSIERVGIYDNFFELGGHSLLATILVSRIRKVFQVELPLQSLFEAATVAELSQQIKKQQREGMESTIPPLQVVERDEKIPLSFAQQRLWFLDQLEPESGVYNISAAIRIEGQLNQEVLAQSFSEIIRRHEVLRTNFVKQDEEAVQIIHPPSDWQMNITDLQALPISEREAEIKRLAIAEAAKPFNLATDQLVRGTLLLVSEREHVLLLTMHHIVSDGWSMGVLIKEMTTLYSAFAQGKPSPLSKLAIQYADFAVWQRKWLTGEELQNQLSYWQKQLAGAAPRLELPTDYPRPAVQTFQGANQSFSIPLELTKGLTTLSQLEGTTLFMTLLAAFQTLLYRYTGQTDISVGSPIANRNHEEIEGLIGFFVNTLVLRTQLENHPSFRELLQQVREVSLGAYAHQDLPFEMLVEQLQPERNLSHTPLFQVLFVLQNAPTSELEFEELTLSELPIDNNTAKFDLTLSLHETEDGLRGNWEYNTYLFDEQTISRMAGHFHTLLSAIVANPEQKVSELPLLTEIEQQQLLFDWNNTSTEYPLNKCIHTLFEEQVERTPEAVAVVLENQQLTYRELNHRANQLAHYLKTQGVGVETLVGICVERSLEMVIGLLGVLKAGGAYVPLDPNYPSERLAYMIADAQISLLLTQQKLQENLINCQVNVVHIDTDWEKIAKEVNNNPDTQGKSENPAYAIYTSGSTGKPKGVMIEHKSAVNLVNALNQAVYNNHHSPLNISLNASLCFDSSVKQVLQLLNGHTLYIVSEEARHDVNELLSFIKNNALDVLDCTPSYLKLLLAAGSNQTPELILIGGEAIDSDTWKLLINNTQTSFYNVYGPTECTVNAAICRIAPTHKQPTIGLPIANTQIYILDSQMQPVPIGVPGELHIGGDGLARGYLNRPELTAEKFIPNPFSEEPQGRLYK
ncbi:MAG: NcpA, partial [Cyanobacteriota bacterium]